MTHLPQAIIIVDPIAEHNALTEAIKTNPSIPVVALANTNANPEVLDFIIPVNTRYVKPAALIVSILADAIAEANGKPTKVVDQDESTIILPDTSSLEKVANVSFVSHKKFTRDYSKKPE
jgi:small subunit ribosomal protein S2